MLQPVSVGRWSLDSYEGIVPAPILEGLREQAKALSGARILHVNATPYGGGVSELLRSSVPLLRDLGLAVDWQVLGGSPEFFRATKALHNALQGAPHSLSQAEQKAYLDCTRENAPRLDDGYDFIVVHDPQPAALLSVHGRGQARTVWRCHIDTSEPNPEAWRFLRPFIADFDAAVFTMPEFVPPDLPVARVRTIAPAIDPLSPKNIDLSDRTASQILDWIGVDLPGRLVTQVSRFDPWKDPFGVIAAYRLARPADPHLHQPDGREQRRGERLSATIRRDRAEVDPRGLRPGRVRVPVEGHAGRRRSRRRHPDADARRRRRPARGVRRGVRGGDAEAAQRQRSGRAARRVRTLSLIHI